MLRASKNAIVKKLFTHTQIGHHNKQMEKNRYDIRICLFMRWHRCLTP